MTRLNVLAAGVWLALALSGCSKTEPESEIPPADNEEGKELSSRAKGRLDCDIAWAIFEQDDKLIRAYGGHPTTLEDAKTRAKGLDQIVTQWQASSSKLRSDKMGKRGDGVVALAKQRHAICKNAIERAERGEPVPTAAKAVPTAEPKTQRPLTEREKALKAAAEEGMKGLLGDTVGKTIFSSDETKLLEANRRMIRDARGEVLDFCYEVDYQPKDRKKK